MKNDGLKHGYKYIVGIGASAGGLEALQKLLSALPSNTGFPFIVIQHLSPDYKSLLGEILGKYTDMPVIQAEDNMTVLPNRVHIIQPGKNMRIESGRLKLVDQIPKELNLPIDIFFRSLAEDAGTNAIAIVLSGTGSDGTNGIKSIKENEGMVLVQDLETAKFDGMPRSAMRTGLVDAQLSPEEIAIELEHISGLPLAAERGKTLQEIDAELMRKVYAVLKKVSNVNFTHYKQTTILRRMERRMMITHKEQLSDYVDYLLESPEEVRVLSKEVLIGVTSFFRDPDYFQLLKDKAITDIVSRSQGEEPIRVWVAGCSTGEEAYSIAILFSEVMDSMKLKRELKIFATDLDTEAITTASKGLYGDNIVDAVSPSRLSKYFTRKNNAYLVNREIRKMIVFSPHNVFQDPPFGRLDMISCRNMLIYFQPVLQNDLFAIFHQALKDGGYLFLGKSEAIGSYTDAFPIVDAAAKIFGHCADAKIAGSKKVPYLQTTYMDEELSGDSGLSAFSLQMRSERSAESSAVSIDNSILEQFLPATVVINEKNELIHTYGDTSNVMHFSLGRYSSNLFDLITEALKIPVSTLLKESRDKKRKAQYRDIRFTGERENSVIDLTVAPASHNNSVSENLYAIVFAQTRQDKADTDSVVYDVDRVSSQRITDLEQELVEKQTKLDQSVSEQETVNEELQAANEELLTANEELQSSNEELQSVNEELYTVNSEYQQKLTELSDLNDDIANFLSSTLTGIIFVDNKLNIRRYTDYVTSEFSVMDHDIGRSLAFISYHFPAVDITEICTNVLKTLIPNEREITTNSGKSFFMRVAPYRSTENKILGCVITLMDITKQKQNQESLLSTEKRLSMAQQASDAKSDYLSRIAHEIHSPMTSLMGLVRNARALATDDAQKAEIDKIAQTIDYMTSIVTDISEASVCERLSKEQITEPFVLRDMLESVSEAVRPKLDEAGVSYKLLLDEGFNPSYIGSRAKLQQILLGFLSSSLRHTEKGDSITLRVFEELGRSEKAKLCLIVSDTGSYIKKENLDKLFKPFSDIAEENRTPSNAWLGLSTAYNEIISLGGSVSAKSEEGKGSTFTITVLLDRQTEADKEQREQAFSNNLSGKNVLIAEDNALNRTILGALIKNEGMTYAEAQDGEEAVKKFTDEPAGTFDCILMDMRMPKLDGIRATAKIRASGKPDAKTVPIIGVSANGFVDDIRKAQDAGVNEYTTKPIYRENLLTAIRKLIKR